MTNLNDSKHIFEKVSLCLMPAFSSQVLHLKKSERRRNREHLNSVGSNDLRQAKFEDGKLYYEGQWFAIGSSVYIDKIGSSPL